MKTKELKSKERCAISGCKQRGEWAELCFMARAAGRGLSVTRPHGDSASYDVGIEHNGRYVRVQSNPPPLNATAPTPATSSAKPACATHKISSTSSPSISCPSTSGTSFLSRSPPTTSRSISLLTMDTNSPSTSKPGTSSAATKADRSAYSRSSSRTPAKAGERDLTTASVTNVASWIKK